MKPLLLCLWLLYNPFSTWATEPQQVDKTMQASLAAFFAAKPQVKGITPELMKVQKWPNAKGTVRWSLPPLKSYPKRLSLIAEQGHGKHYKRWYVPVLVKWMADVVVLKQDISARTMLDKSMLSKTRTDIAGLHGHTWSNIQGVVGLKSLRSLRQGSVLVSSYVKRPPLIQRGDVVSIVAKVAGIQVRAEGIALKSGSRGDRMLVRNIRSKQTLQSTVQDAHTVSVFVGGA